MALGSDIAMVLDVCSPYPCHYEEAKKGLSSLLNGPEDAECSQAEGSSLFGIVQAVLMPICAGKRQAIVEMDFPGYAIGGLSAGNRNP